MTHIKFYPLYEKQAMMGIFECPLVIFRNSVRINIANRFSYLNAISGGVYPSNEFKEVRCGKN